MESNPPTTGDLAYANTVDVARKVDYLMLVQYRNHLRDVMSSEQCSGRTPSPELVCEYFSVDARVADSSWILLRQFGAEGRGW